MSYFDLKVGFTCNNNCIHCVITDKKSTADLTTQQVIDIIDKIPKDQTVGFTGGEATIREDFLFLIKYAKDAGHQVALQTNGTVFSNMQFAKEASKYLSSVLIAIHSCHEDIHNSIVRSPGMYARTIQGFKNIVELGIPCTTQTVISKKNIDSILDTYDFIQKIKPGIKMSLTFPHPNGNAFSNSDIVVPRYVDIKNQLQAILQKYGLLLNTEAIPLCYLYPYQDIVFNHDKSLLENNRSGLDPANKNSGFFDKDGYVENYSNPILNDRRKAPKCIECSLNNQCLGVWKEYITIHGHHFDLFPIKDDVCNTDCKAEQSQMQDNKPDLSQIQNFKNKLSTMNHKVMNHKIIDKKENNQQEKWGAIIVYGSSKCMNTCLFCGGTTPHVDEGEKFDKLIKECDFHISNGVNCIEVSGGDPGEYRRLPEILQHLKNNGVFRIKVSTHGRTFKDASFVKACADAGMTEARIPIYSTNEKIHNKCVQVNNSIGNAFEDTIQGIKNCTNIGIPICGHIILNQYNKLDINNIIKMYLDLTHGNMTFMGISVIFIAQLDYSYTRDWFLPMKDMIPYLQDVYLNHPPIPSNIKFMFFDIPYCIFGKKIDEVYNPAESYPDLGLHDVDGDMQSAVSNKIPHYRIKTYFDACEMCSLKGDCGGITVNEIKMFGTHGLKPVLGNK